VSWPYSAKMAAAVEPAGPPPIMTTSGIGQDFNNVGYGFPIGSAKEVCPAVEFNFSGDFELLLDVFVRLNTEVSLRFTDEGEIVVDEDTSERFLALQYLLAKFFRKDFKVNFDGTVFNRFASAVINEKHFSEVTVGFLGNVESFEGDAGAVISFKACGHIPVVNEEMPLWLG
jgi:hypothetical protein